jgi:ABC-2 type transport system permease protein
MKTIFARVWALSVKEFIHLRNDWWMPAFMLVGGAMELLLVGWATSRPIVNLPLMVLDRDRSQASRALVAALENTGTFQLKEQTEDLAVVEDSMARGDIYAVVVIPPDYSSQLASPLGHPTVQVLLNGMESTPATAALRAIEGVFNDLSERLTLQRLNLSAQDLSGFNPSLRIWYNADLSEAYYTTPAELALMLEFTVLLFAALSFSRERELGTLEQLLVMPFSSLEIIVGKSIPVVIIGFLDFLVMLGVVHFAFGVPVRGSTPLLLLLAFGYLFVELSKGLVISVISRTQHQAFLLVMVVGMVDFMFTGYAAPVESMPPVLQYVANLIPANHWLNILRGIMLKGAGLEVLWTHVLALLILGLVIGGFSLRFVRRALN